MRVLVTGMGSELGTQVAVELEGSTWAGDVLGIDGDPPRRRLRRSIFHRVDPRDRRRTAELIREFDPEVVAHLGIWEPNARAMPKGAAERTRLGTIYALGAVAQCPSLQRIVMRSGIEVYGRRRRSPTRPDEAMRPDPTSPFGASLLEAEGLARSAADAADASVCLLRLAPVVGPHLASPLGRYLRLPVVPVSVLGDLPFSLLHQDDAARAVVAALQGAHEGPLNVVAPGAVTAFQAARMGGRLPVAMLGPGWRAVRPLAELLGSPIPAHVLELLHRGRTADGGEAENALGITLAYTTPEVVKDLYEWASVTSIRPRDRAAA